MRCRIVPKTHKGIARELVALGAVSDASGTSAVPEDAVAAEDSYRICLAAPADQIIGVHAPLLRECLDRTRVVRSQNVAGTAVEPARTVMSAIHNHSAIPPIRSCRLTP